MSKKYSRPKVTIAVMLEIAEALFEFSKSKAMNDISSNLKEEERKRLEELI